MISAKRKGVKPLRLGAPPDPQKRSDLSYLPKYICYKAALLREKLVLSYVVVVLAMLLGVYFIVSRVEISRLHDQLRAKEYILAPGVQNFTPASPQAVSAAYVHDAATDFISSLGTVNASSIVEEYAGLKRFMSDSFKIKFDVATSGWLKKVRKDDLAQILTVQRKEIVSDQKGSYKVTAFGRADFYAAGQYIGHEDQVIEMALELTPPAQGKRWYLQITSLTWSKLETYNNRNSFESNNTKKEEIDEKAL